MSGGVADPRIARARRGGFPPGPDMLRSARLLATFFDDPVEWYVELRASWGDLVGLRAGPLRMIVAFDADLLERVLVKEAPRFHKGHGLRVTRIVLGNGLITADGELHRSHRRLAAPVFTPRTIEPFADATVEIARDVLSRWPDEGVVAGARDSYDISLRVAGVGLFGTDFDDHERERLHEAMRQLNDGYRLLAAPGGPRLVRARATPRARRIHDAREHVEDVIRALVSARRADADAAAMRDLLSRLLAARDDGDGASFTDQELRDEAVTMLLAGHDTTAATLGWCLAMLALHPEEQQRARAEVDELLAGRPAGAADLRSLVRVRAVVEETMRLHPAVYSTVRDPIEPIPLEGGVVLRPGTDLVVPIAAMHRDPRHWDDPLRFAPGRFLDGAAVAARHRMAHLPFGTGPRVCIGSSFAMQELVLVVATLLQQFEISAPPGFRLLPHVGFIRRPAGDLPLRVRRRPAFRGPG